MSDGQIRRAARAVAGAGLGWILAMLGVLSSHAAEAAAASAEPVIELPPMIVTESSKGPPWLYAQTSAGEFLSRCSQSTTREFIETRQRLVHILQVLVPEAFFVKMDVPSVTVLDALGSRPAGNDAVIQDMLKQEQEVSRGQSGANLSDPLRGRGGRGRVQFLPNLRLEDRDMTALFAYLDDTNFDGSRLFLSPDYVRFMLQRRTPMLPPWVIEGVLAIYGQTNLAADPITIRAFEWLSPAESRALERDPERPRVLLAMADLFAPGARLGAAADDLRVKVWRAQVALFVRWALDSRHSGMREAFWKFAARAAEEPVTEAIFEQCFGFGFSEMRDRLSDYLPRAVRDSLRLPRGKLPQIPRPEVSKATPEQIARLRGEWERMEVPYVKARHASFAGRYADQARRTLGRVVAQGDADPRVVAALGLCELDAGDEKEARGFLEAAVAANVWRPRAYYELARLRYTELSGADANARQFSAEELTPVVSLLRIAITRAPPLPEAYVLLAEAWLRCRTAPPEEDLVTLAKGAAAFGRLPLISHRVALLHLAHGKTAEAARLLGQAMDRTDDPETRAALAELQDLMGRRRSP